MIYKNDITSLKENIGEKLGQKIIVKGSAGRSKPFAKEATIEKTYPSFFAVRYNDESKSETYSYVDVLTRTVEVDAFDGVQYSSLVPPLEPKVKNK